MKIEIIYIFQKSKYPDLNYFIEKNSKEGYRTQFDTLINKKLIIMKKLILIILDLLSNFIQIENPLNTGHYFLICKNKLMNF